MNVFVIKRQNSEVVARYEVHLAGASDAPADQEYFDDAWERAVSDRLVEPDSREDYHFRLQKPKTLYESSQ